MTKQSLAVLAVLVAVATGALMAQQPPAPPAAVQTPPAGAQAGRGRGAPTAPPPITWNSPPLPDGPMLYETGLVRPIRITATKGLNQPWSMAFLPDGAILVTERPGRLRIVRNGVLDPTPVAGLPAIAAQGLAGLMDIALHPQFAQNSLVYFTYHKPTAAPAAAAAGGAPAGPAAAGTITLARGTLGRRKAGGCARSLFRAALRQRVAHRLRPRRHDLHVAGLRRPAGRQCES